MRAPGYFMNNRTKFVNFVNSYFSEYRDEVLNDAIALRRATLKNKVPYCTNMSTALAFIEGIKCLKTKKLEINSLQDLN